MYQQIEMILFHFFLLRENKWYISLQNVGRDVPWWAHRKLNQLIYKKIIKNKINKIEYINNAYVCAK